MTRDVNFDDVDALVVGTSAGGVDALMRLLPALPAHARAAVIVVLHLPRQRPSALVEIFAPRCALGVSEAEDKVPIASGKIYFAPPDYHLLVDALPGPMPRTALFALSVDDPVNYSRPSIDVLFESAADVYGKRLAGMILTGANADGAVGLAAVRDAGGVTIVQEPQSAVASAMPAAALARGPVDFVLPLDEIARLLRSFPVALTDAERAR